MSRWFQPFVVHSFLVVASFPCIAGAKEPALAGAPRLPFAFVENKGQAQPDVRYIGNGPAFKAWFRDRGVTFQQGAAVVTMEFVGAQAGPRLEASGPLGATANYFHGSDPDRWQSGLPLFNSLSYSGVWQGIEIRFGASDSRTKAEYIVAPGVPVSGIRLRFDGQASIQDDGSLIVSGKTGAFHEDKPFLYQGEGEGRAEVAGSFRRFDDGTIGFDAGTYDRTKPLVIDPTILFSGYFGGTAQSNITAVAVNSYYNIIVAGWTVATDLPAAGGAKTASGGGVDAFVAGFSPSGGNLIFCTYLGGSGDDRAFGLAVDSSNNTYITGWTGSSNFPLKTPLQAKLSGARDAFVTKLNAAGNTLVYSTYLGGSGVDSGNAIALDSTNAAVIVGDTTSSNLPTTAGAVQPKLGGGQDVFVAKLNTAGTAVSFMTYFGGTATDHGTAVKLDSSGSIFFAGGTFSQNFPTLRPWQSHSGGGQDGFIAKLASTGAPIIYSTYFGGSGGTAGAPEQITTLALGPTGIPYVGGITSSQNFPVTSTLQTVFGGGLTDGFFARFDPSSGALQKCSFFGGSGDDGINAMAIDFFGDIYITGYTSSADLPVKNPIQNAIAGGMNAFVAKVIPGLILFSTYLGGGGSDSANAIAVDSVTSVVVAGSTGSWNFPVSGNIGGWQGSALSSFVTKLAPNFSLNVVAQPTFYSDPWHDTGYNGTSTNLTSNTFGLASDVPVLGDWDGSGVKRIGVFRSGTWILDTNGNGTLDVGDKTVQFGQAGDIPIVGDWNGSGRIKLGLFRQGSFILDMSGHLSGVPTGLADAGFAFGLSTDLPVVGDWNQSGTSKVGVFRNGLWLVDYNGDQVFNGSDKTYAYGQAGDVPVVGDWQSTGVSEIGVYRNGVWILNYSGSNSVVSNGVWDLYLGFGAAGYKPLL